MRLESNARSFQQAQALKIHSHGRDRIPQGCKAESILLLLWRTGGNADWQPAHQRENPKQRGRPVVGDHALWWERQLCSIWLAQSPEMDGNFLQGQGRILCSMMV